MLFMGSGLKKEITLQPLFGPLLKSTAAETLGSIKRAGFPTKRGKEQQLWQITVLSLPDTPYYLL